MKNLKIIHILVAASLVLIGIGLFLIYPPACPLGVGLLIWFDISMGGKRERP